MLLLILLAVLQFQRNLIIVGGAAAAAAVVVVVVVARVSRGLVREQRRVWPYFSALSLPSPYRPIVSWRGSCRAAAPPVGLTRRLREQAKTKSISFSLGR